jgi:thiol-disulfide isomerase/thioredoxin
MAVVKVNDQEFKEALAENDLVVVKYFANWCGNCKLFAPKYKRVSNEDDFEGVAFLDVNAEENPEARKMAGVDNLPFLAAFKNGELVEGSASSKEDYLRSLLEKLKN